MVTSALAVFSVKIHEELESFLAERSSTTMLRLWQIYDEAVTTFLDAAEQAPALVCYRPKLRGGLPKNMLVAPDLARRVRAYSQHQRVPYATVLTTALTIWCRQHGYEGEANLRLGFRRSIDSSDIELTAIRGG